MVVLVRTYVQHPAFWTVYIGSETIFEFKSWTPYLLLLIYSYGFVLIFRVIGWSSLYWILINLYGIHNQKVEPIFVKSQLVSEWVRDWVSGSLIDWVNPKFSELIRDLVSGSMIEFVDSWLSEWVRNWVSVSLIEWENPQISLWICDKISESVIKWVNTWLIEWIHD